MARLPLLLLSDSAAGVSGLGRITRDLALHIHEHMSDVFDIAVYGYGAPPSDELPFRQFQMTVENFIPTNLPEVWGEFAGESRGALLTIFNASWLNWLAFPEKCPNLELREFLLTLPFTTWGYFPIDSDVRPGRLALNLAEGICGFDRVLHYTDWAKRITDTAIAEVYPKHRVASSVLPHGIDRDVFYKRDRRQARATLFERISDGENQNPIEEGIVLIGAFGTNSERKAWPLAFEVCEKLVQDGMNVGLLCHVDHPRKHFDLLALTREFNLQGRVMISTGQLTDDDLAWVYSACDATIGLAPEGMGYCIMEAIACGVPTIVGDYAACGEYVEPQFKVSPVAFRHEGFFNSRRPVYLASEFAYAVRESLGEVPTLPENFYWDKLWPIWENWLRAGLQDGVDCKHTEVREVVTSE